MPKHNRKQRRNNRMAASGIEHAPPPPPPPPPLDTAMANTPNKPDPRHIKLNPDIHTPTDFSLLSPFCSITLSPSTIQTLANLSPLDLPLPSHLQPYHTRTHSNDPYLHAHGEMAKPTRIPDVRGPLLSTVGSLWRLQRMKERLEEAYGRLLMVEEEEDEAKDEGCHGDGKQAEERKKPEANGGGVIPLDKASAINKETPKIETGTKHGKTDGGNHSDSDTNGPGLHGKDVEHDGGKDDVDGKANVNESSPTRDSNVNGDKADEIEINDSNPTLALTIPNRSHATLAIPSEPYHPAPTITPTTTTTPMPAHSTVPNPTPQPEQAQPTPTQSALASKHLNLNPTLNLIPNRKPNTSPQKPPRQERDEVRHLHGHLTHLINVTALLLDEQILTSLWRGSFEEREIIKRDLQKRKAELKRSREREVRKEKRRQQRDDVKTGGIGWVKTG